MTEQLLKVNNLCKFFKTSRGMLHAVDDVTFTIDRGKTLGVVGESGCGKSTTGRAILRLLEPTAGQVYFEGEDISALSKRQMRKKRKDMQIIFQDPFSSLNPRKTISQAIMEPMIIHDICETKAERMEKVLELMDVVGLAQRLVNTYPHELDGGRRQRIGIARALALDPKFIVCDDIAVMYLGKLIEKAPSEELFLHPTHPYTQALLSAIPVPSIRKKRERIILKGEITSPIEPKPICRFANRCMYTMDICTETEPELREILPGHFVACHLCER